MESRRYLGGALRNWGSLIEKALPLSVTILLLGLGCMSHFHYVAESSSSWISIELNIHIIDDISKYYFINVQYGISLS